MRSVPRRSLSRSIFIPQHQQQLRRGSSRTRINTPPPLPLRLLLLLLLICSNSRRNDCSSHCTTRFCEAIVFLSSTTASNAAATRASILVGSSSASSFARIRQMSCFADTWQRDSWQHGGRNSIRFLSVVRRTTITMMPEGPEVRAVVDQFRAGGVGTLRLVDVSFVSGRYHVSKNGPPEGFSKFAATMTPVAEKRRTRIISNNNNSNNNNIATGNANANNNAKKLPDPRDWFQRSMMDDDNDNDNVAATSSATSDDDDDDDEPVVDLITDWNCKGKFIYILLDNGAAAAGRRNVDGSSNSRIASAAAADFQRSIWITLGMTGRFLSEAALKDRESKGQASHVRWCLELVKVVADNTSTANKTAAAAVIVSAKNTSNKTTKIYYSDTRNFGTLKFCLSRQALLEKLQSLGPDMLSTCTEQDFLNVIASHKNQEKNVCRFLMDQSNLAGIGNYILAEGLYRANVDPFASLSELDISRQRLLFRELKAVTTESYQSQTTVGATAADEASFEYQCYGQQVCKRRGRPVRKETNGPHGRTIWYTDEQLFMPRHERDQPALLLRGVYSSSGATIISSARTPPSGNDVSSEMTAIPRNRTAAAATPGNAKLAAILLANKVGEAEPVASSATISTLGRGNKQAATVAKNKRSEIGGLVGPARPSAAETPGNAKLAAILASKNGDSQKIGVLGPPSSAAAALTPGNAKLAAILANKGAKLGDVGGASSSIADASRTNGQAVTVTTDPSTLVTYLLAGLTEPGWKGVLLDTLQKSESFSKLAVFLEEERLRGETVYPPSKDIFNALNLCPLDATKVVIVGQDPYHGPDQGHGLAFSVRKGVRPPPSLLNIFKELIDDVGIDDPKHGNLECWARQGVLLLNTVLTVREGEANSHAGKGWEEVTDAIIREVSERNQRADSCGLVFLLWGKAAAKKVGRVLVDEDAHTTIQTSHPSPLGATKTKSPFIGSKCFSLANKALIAMGRDPVDWSVE